MALEIFDGALNTGQILDFWYKKEANNGSGAFCTFIGIVRGGEEGEALSFDIYEPLLEAWFEAWQERADKKGARIYMAHSNGDVGVGRSSFIAAAASKHRRAALDLLDLFVEDFKASAPIWKYDLQAGKRIYARARSKAIKGAGVLG